MTLSSPLITVLMPVYNTEKYVSEAIGSILTQTFTDFEFIIIDDASTDNSLDIIKSFNDPRIKLIIKPINTGYTDSLNRGLRIARGKYIARMDSDDFSLPFRLETQLVFMDANPDVAVCGSWYRFMHNNNIVSFPEKHDEIKAALLSYCALGHPTVMLRNSFLKTHQLNYDITMEPAEDYDLWTRVSMVGKLSNIQEVLLLYRNHENQVTVLKKNKRLSNSMQIRGKLVQQLNPALSLSIASLDISYASVEGHLTNHYDDFVKMIRVCNDLKVINRRKMVFIPEALEDFLNRQKFYLINVFFSYCAKNKPFFIFKTLTDFHLFYGNFNVKKILKYLFARPDLKYR